MLLPPNQNPRILSRARACPASLPDELARADWSHARILKDTPTSSVLLARIARTDIILKTSPLPDALSRARSLLRCSRAWAQRRGSIRLASHDIPAARVLAIVRGTHASTPVETLALEALPGESALHALARRDLPPRAEHDLARSLGELTARLHAAGLANRDHKPSNIQVIRRAPLRLALLDTVAIRRRSSREPWRMLACLAIEPRGCRCLPRRALLMRALHAALPGASRADIRAAWARVRTLVEAHAHPTPRDNPLAHNPTPLV